MIQAQAANLEYKFGRFDIEHSKRHNTYVAQLTVYPRNKRTSYKTLLM